jgi:glycosyltransferase involved in cell wall biosynthesis
MIEQPLRVLFVKHALAWPRAAGHDVHCFHMMKALSELGAQVSLVTAETASDLAIAGLPLTLVRSLERVGAEGGDAQAPIRLSRMQERYRSYFGVPVTAIKAVRAAALECAADVVVAVGLDVLPYLGGIDRAVRVWYVADEQAYQHLSRIRAIDHQALFHLKHAFIKGLYERVYRPLIDRVWVVSDTERRAARWLAGMRVVDVLPNGVDADYYQPSAEPEVPRSLVFWGRLDFGTNVEALDWFGRKVWPALREEAPDAQFTIIGFDPTDAVKRLAESPGISLLANVPDLRAVVGRHMLVVLPFVSGSGIKNKLLEAAALGKPIVCTPRSCRGLRSAAEAGLVTSDRPVDWINQIRELWRDDARRHRLGAQARDWVVEHHSWVSTARDALNALGAHPAPSHTQPTRSVVSALVRERATPKGK